MMTQPIQMFESLTSETSPAGGNVAKANPTNEERRMLELRARYVRAQMLGDGLADGLVWLGRQFKRLVAAIKTDFRVRAAESQLFSMSDRELADIGLCRADIPFAVRETAHGVMPEVDHVTHGALPANENLRRVA